MSDTRYLTFLYPDRDNKKPLSLVYVGPLKPSLSICRILLTSPELHQITDHTIVELSVDTEIVGYSIPMNLGEKEFVSWCESKNATFEIDGHPKGLARFVRQANFIEMLYILKWLPEFHKRLFLSERIVERVLMRTLY